MKAVFADAFYFFALLNPGDEAHARVNAWSREFDGDVVTTEFVLVEVADGLAHSRRRREAVALVESLHATAGFRVVESGTELLHRGLALYGARIDKAWSLTDCISFVVMEERKLTDALTGDRHFEQAGFRVLFGE